MKKKYGVIIISTLILVVSLTLIINKPSYAGLIPETNYCPDQIIINGGGNQEILPGISLQLLGATLPTGEPLDNTVLTLSRKDTPFGVGVVANKEYEGTIQIPVFSKNLNENRYYTQLFLWWMNDINLQGDIDLSKEEKEAIASSENGKIVAERIDEYERYWASDYDTPPTLDNIDMSNVTYHVTNDYIETSLITPDCTNDNALLFTDYIVETTAPVIAVDENGNEQKTLPQQ